MNYQETSWIALAAGRNLTYPAICASNTIAQ
jgi:hypothetical protein